MNEKEDDAHIDKQDEIQSPDQQYETTSDDESLEAMADEPDVVAEDKEAPQPHNEQLKYWKQDLRLKRITLGLSTLGFIAIVISIVFNTNQISISTEQLKLNTKQVQLSTEQSERLAESLCYSLQSEVLVHVIGLDKVFLERTYLRRYFYDNEPINDKDKYYHEAVATAEMILDIFDIVADQNKKYPQCWDNAATWDEWIIDTFSASPILRETMERRRDWYANNLLELYERALERSNK